LHEYGGCHCRNVHWTLRSGLAASELPVRACQCEFCRKHRALSTSDAQGEMNFTVLDRGALIRYRFATKSAEFLVCARCGIYVGAQMEEDGRFYAIANLRAFDVSEEFARRAQPMDYSGENSNARRTRRARRWTPVCRPDLRGRVGQCETSQCQCEETWKRSAGNRFSSPVPRA
jgi:hypothetical protein